MGSVVALALSRFLGVTEAARAVRGNEARDRWVLRLLGCVLVWGALSAGAADTGGRVLTTARSVLELNAEVAAQSLRTRIRGVVTCSSARASLFFVQDETAGIYVYQMGSLPPQGTSVEVEGVSAAGLFSPIIYANTVTSLGSTSLPPARVVAIEELASGRHDSQWIEVEGVVIRQEENWGHQLLTLASGSARLEVRILEPESMGTNQWIDARVKVQGVAGTTYNDRRQLTGFHMLVQTGASLRVLRAPQVDPFALPLRKSGSLLVYDPQGATEHRARLRGVVTWAWPGHDFFIRDAGGDVRIATREKETPKPGDVVDAVGFPAPRLTRPELKEAMFRVLGQTNIPQPRIVDGTKSLKELHDGELVVLEGVVRQAPERHADHSALVTEVGESVVRVFYQDAWNLGISPRWLGSRIRVKGVWTADAESVVSPSTMSLWLGAPGDLEILERSSQWKGRLAMGWVGGLGGVVALGGAWIAMLRYRVRIQTEAIRKREAALEERYRDLFENANDILYTLNLDGEITSMNQSGLTVFGLRESEILGRNIENLVDPEDLPMMRRQRETKLAGVPRTTYELRLRGAQGQPIILEVNSRLIYRDGAAIGVQGIARDITERKEAEEALRASEQQMRVSLEERERLGRDLHDSIIQSIYAVGLNLDDCARITTREPEAVEKRLRKITADLNLVIREVRSFIGKLERNGMSGNEFKTALRSMTLSYEEGGGLEIDLQIEDDAVRDLEPSSASQLLNIAREAIGNAARHAKARFLVVSLRLRDHTVCFEVTDDGVGFDPVVSGLRGRGLRNMKARAGQIGASFCLVSKTGEGTRLLVELPLRSHHESTTEHSHPNR
ncbi:MAG: PAS domain S-box protein [Verrucomicrobiales bacterium]|nr:PAS domain S-box protein [Verrucomicrobiales bacterium]